MHWDDVHGIFHKCRYKIDYYGIEFRRKYYSNSRSPRVIHTKLKDQVLVSLRTCPQDKYFPRANEYLTLAGCSDTESVAERYLMEPTPLDNFEETITFDEGDLELGELFMAVTPQTPQTSPMSQDMDKERLNELRSAFVEKLDMRALYDIQRMLARFPFTGTLMQSRIGQNGIVSPTKSVDQFHTCYKCPRFFDDGKMVWKTEVNDVSLSATGLCRNPYGTCKYAYESLTGDYRDWT